MLDADPGKALKTTAYTGINAVFIVPGRPIYTTNQQGQTLPFEQPEKDVVQGKRPLSLRTVGNQRVLAMRMGGGSTLMLSKSLTPAETLLRRLLIVGAICVAIAAVAGALVWRARPGERPPATEGM